jgi:hypothetical protein
MSKKISTDVDLLGNGLLRAKLSDCDLGYSWFGGRNIGSKTKPVYIRNGVFAECNEISASGGAGSFSDGLVLPIREINSSGTYSLNHNDVWIIFNSSSGTPRFYLGSATEGRTVFMKNLSRQGAFVAPAGMIKLFDDSMEDSHIEMQDGDLVMLTYKVLVGGTKAWVTGKFRY